MPSRLQQLQIYPWTGGLVTSLDQALIQPDQLTQADNVLFSTQGTRLKREGISYDWDDLNIVTASRSSSAATRTITTNGYKWTLGETFRITGMGASDYNSGTATATVTAVSSTNTSTVTITNASPGVVTWVAHGLSNGDVVKFTTTGALPTPLEAEVPYYVLNAATDTFQLALTSGGSAINTSSAGSGTHTAREALENVISYTFSGADTLNESTTADTSGTITLLTNIVAVLDYWYGATDTRTQKIMAFSSMGRLYEVDPTTGARTQIEDIGTQYVVSPALTRASMVVFENRLMIAVDGSSNVMKHYFPTSLGGSGALEDVENTTGFEATPKASFLQVHIGRLWANDKERADRLHYTETGVYNKWQGVGDSGAIDIGTGDGDPDGLTAIFPSYKGVLVVAKRTKIYKLAGPTPDFMSIETMSTSLGCVGHQAVASIDGEDIVFVSDRGVHSINATDQFGDLAASYLSADIQASINAEWQRSTQKQITAAYLAQINSVALTTVNTEDTDQRDLWLLNFQLKRWYRWPDLNAKCVATINNSDKQRFYFGTSNGRIAKSFIDRSYDVSNSGAVTPITMTLATGFIFPDKNPLSHKAFKKVSLIFNASNVYTIDVDFKIDAFSTQSIAFDTSSAGALLGSSFVLGSSALGISPVTAGYTEQVDGYGRGFKLTLTQSSTNALGELLGFVVYFELAEPAQETRMGDGS